MGGHAEAAGSGQDSSNLSGHPGSCFVYPAWKGNLAGVVNLQVGSQDSPAFQILPQPQCPQQGEALTGAVFLCVRLHFQLRTRQHKRAPCEVRAAGEVGPSVTCDKPDVGPAHTLTNPRDILQDENLHPIPFAEFQGCQVTGPESHCLAGVKGTPLRHH